MNYSQIKKDAKENLKGNWGTVVFAIIVYGLLSGLVESVGFMTETFFLSLIGTIVFVVMYGPLEYGIRNIFLKVNRKQKTEISDLFSGFSNNFGQKVSAGLSIYIYTFLWSLLLIIPGIVASYSYSMTYYIMKDNPNISSNEAIARSKRLMNGHKMELFCLDLSFIGWILLGIITLGIGLLFVIPYMNASHARFYEAINGITVSTNDAVTDTENAQEANTKVVNKEDVRPYAESDANVIYRLKCDVCGATETHTSKTTSCPYCGAQMHEQK